MTLSTAWTRIALVAPLLAGALGLAACSGAPNSPDLKILYNRSAQYHLPDRNPVIVIPGILGSKLIDRPTGTRVWGAFVHGAADPQTEEGVRLIALPIGDEGSLRDRTDSVEADGVLDRVRVQFGLIPLEIRAYAGILATLGVGGDRDESLGLGAIDYGTDHFTCFQFSYDWRRDKVENAQRLKAFIDEKREQVRAIYRERYGIEKDDIKFDIVAHSMGGLVTRYFMRYGDQDLPDDGTLPDLTWAGAEDVERVILVGTPSAGSVDALRQLVEGKNLGPLLPYYQPALMGTFPAIYQLLPRNRHKHVVYDGDLNRPVPDLLDPDLWVRHEWGLLAPDQDKVLRRLLPDTDDPARRRVLAEALLRLILRRTHQFMAALDVPAALPEGLDISLVAGDVEKTPQRLSVDSRTGAVEILDHAAGDGTVLRTSALMDERLDGTWQPSLRSPIAWNHVLFLNADHLGLTQDPAFTDNVLYWLLEEPRK